VLAPKLIDIDIDGWFSGHAQWGRGTIAFPSRTDPVADEQPPRFVSRQEDGHRTTDAQT
jgi:hypothetical protein